MRYPSERNRAEARNMAWRVGSRMEEQLGRFSALNVGYKLLAEGMPDTLFTAMRNGILGQAPRAKGGR